MYSGVPTVIPVAVSRAACVAEPVTLAMPKSAILTRPSAVSMTFSGLRSRWTMPRLSACASPASSPSSTPAACASVIPRMIDRSVPLVTYSIAMNGTPPCSK